jgi:hypothetical protein
VSVASEQDAEQSFKSGPWTDLGLTLPIFVGYHLGVIFLPVRNAADVVTRELVSLADNSLPAYGGLTLAIGAVYVAILVVLGRGRALHWDRFLTIALEGIIYAVAMRLVANYVVGRMTLAGGASLLDGAALLDGPPEDGIAMNARFAGLVMSLGAGFYEEVMFRVIGYGLGAQLLFLLFPEPEPLRRFFKQILWAVAMAVVFSGWHYVGTYGDAFELRSFVFRAVCGLVFTAIYHFRGFAPAVWTHTLYDVWVLVL